MELDCRFEIFNLGNSHPVAMQELVSLLEQALAKRAVVVSYPDQPGDVSVTYADISKARRVLGFEPRVELSEGILRFVEWYRREGPARRRKEKLTAVGCTDGSLVSPTWDQSI